MVATRRISVNLEQLGVTLPRTHARSANKLSPSTNSNSATSDDPPAKRVKRSHTLDSSSSSASTTLASRPRPRKPSSISGRRPTLPSHPTPPPSPKSCQGTIIDKEGINDSIVVAVLEQLEATGNRPHLIKQLCAVLIIKLAVVASSQNPVAIISSRLTSYLKRPWTAIAPCPLTKEQVVVHPRRVYYYLTTMPHQPIPAYETKPQPPRHLISPSISSGPDEELDFYDDSRVQRTPSPELTSSMPDETVTNGVSEMQFSDHDFDHTMSMPEPLDPAPAPPQPEHPALEHDEQEFSQTAGVIRQRKESEQASAGASEDDMATRFPSIREEPDGLDMDAGGESDEQHHFRNQEAAALLFGQPQRHVLDFASSPMIRPQQASLQPQLGLLVTKKSPMMNADVFGGWSDLKSPETVELHELDDFLAGY